MSVQHLSSQPQPIEAAELSISLSQAPRNACLQPAWRSVLAMGVQRGWPLLNRMVVLAVGCGWATIWFRKPSSSTQLLMFCNLSAIHTSAVASLLRLSMHI